MFFRLADNGNANSAASWFRRSRVRRFAELLSAGSRECRVLDVGGTEEFWQSHPEELPAHIAITILNCDAQFPVSGVRHVHGDARRMDMFTDGEFDVCFSNSVIEHAGTIEDQSRMASEIRRVGKGYFVQTPNAYFPLEPHFLLPGWQFAPTTLRAELLRRRDCGWVKRVKDARLARSTVESIRLLTVSQMQRLFPDGNIYREKLGFLTKSIVSWRPIS